MISRSMQLRAPLLAALSFLALALAGCATNPVTGRSELSLVSPAQELAIGREGHAAILEEYGQYQDAKLQAYVDSVGRAVAAKSHLPNLEWHFTVLDDPAVNAFATPGGYIYITRGILAHLNSEAQLAGVLGHEIGHVTARHSASRMTQQQIAGLGLGLASIFSETFRKYSDAAQTGLSLMLLKYGRDDENQADQLGVDYSTKAGYDSREIPNTYTMLKRVGDQAGQRLPVFLSTHPDPGDREARTTALSAAAVQGLSGLRINGRDYVQRTDGIVYGSDPRQGYFEDEHYYHPGLAIDLRFPAGWKTQDSRSAVVAAEPQNLAKMQMSLAAATAGSPAAYVDGLVRAGKVTRADGSSETIAGWPAWVGRLGVTNAQGAPGVLSAGFIQRGGEPMLQFLGASGAPGDANEAKILASIRSMRRLTDAARLQPQPGRVRVVRVGVQAPLSQFIAGLGPQGTTPEDEAILNNLELDEVVRIGQLLKTVTPAKRR